MDSEEIIEEQLSNGIRVVAEALVGRKPVSMGIWVDIGSRDKPDSRIDST